MPSLELESRWVGAALEEAPGLSAREVMVSEWPTSVREGVEVLRRSLFCLRNRGKEEEEEERGEFRVPLIDERKKKKYHQKDELTTRGRCCRFLPCMPRLRLG